MQNVKYEITINIKCETLQNLKANGIQIHINENKHYSTYV